jgi:hypothetical protein
MATSLDRDTLLRVVQTWPIDEQILFAQTIIERARRERGDSEPEVDASERSTWDALYGIASGEKEPPTDEQVAQWLDGHKTEKYDR